MPSTPYTLKTSLRARSVRITVHRDGQCVVTVPRFVPRIFAERFVRNKLKWIADKQAYFKKLEEREEMDQVGQRNSRPVMRNTRANYLKYCEQARTCAEAKVRHWNTIYGFTHGCIRIGNQKTRWGSCSRKGTLSFNWKIALLPEVLADYLVVHELCHLGAFDHSAKFWDLVAKAVPEYKERRKELRRWRV